jgi:hypothetical protein
MKPYIKIPIFIIFPVLLLFPAEGTGYSGERTDSLNNHPGLFAGVSFGASRNRIIHEGILSSSDITGENKTGMSGNFGIELGYFFSRYVGISTGVGYSSYNSGLLLNTYSNSFTATDSENETYEKRVSGSAIKEVRNISLLSIPVCLNFQSNGDKPFGLFLKAGVNLSFPVKRQYNSTGTFTYTGYYPAYNILFHDLPEYGFPGNTVISDRGDIELKPFIVEGLANAGIRYTIKDILRISAGVSFSRSLQDISNYRSPGEFQLSSDANSINSMTGGLKSSVTESLGVSISIVYLLK